MEIENNHAIVSFELANQLNMLLNQDLSSRQARNMRKDLGCKGVSPIWKPHLTQEQAGLGDCPDFCPGTRARNEYVLLFKFS